MGTLQGVRGGDGGGIFGREQDDTAWASGRGETELENLDHRGRAADVSHGLPGQGSPAELSGGGVYRKSGYKEGDAGTFSAPACPGNCGHFGGWNPPPPHPWCHICDMLVPWCKMNGRRPSTAQCNGVIWL